MKPVEKTPSVKRVKAVESQSSGNPQREEKPRNQTEPVLGPVHEHGSRDVAGKSEGNGSTPEGITQGHGVAMNMQSPTRVENVVHAGMAVPCVGPDGSCVENVVHAGMAAPNVGPGGPCEMFYIGDGPTSHETNKGVEGNWDVVNPFWSQPQQREALRETYGPGFDVGALGVQQGSNTSTPQKDF